MGFTFLSPAMTNLTNFMFMATFVTWTGAAKFVYAGWFCKETDVMSRLIATQRRRYGFALFGQTALAVAAFMVWHASHGSFANIQAGMHDWMAVPIIGWLVYGTMYALAASPLVSIIVAVAIYRKPSVLARKVGFTSYLPTCKARGWSSAANVPDAVIPFARVNANGRLVRRYVGLIDVLSDAPEIPVYGTFQTER